MQLSEFDFPFDPSLVASEPILPRDRARLLVLTPETGTIGHRTVGDLPDLLASGDLLVVNDTRVRAARVHGRKRSSGGDVEVLFVHEVADRAWEVLMKGKWKEGEVIDVGPDASLTVISRETRRRLVRINSSMPVREFFEQYGRMPLPPYIKRSPTIEDHEWYQTLFAGREGAIAAPTAGLHFTPDLVSRLKAKGIGIAKVTLHVGIGTFKPVTVEQIDQHRMECEWVEVSEGTVRVIEQAKQANHRVVAVGTTAVRALETAALQGGALKPFRGETSLFIIPGFRFQVVDAMMTNFHLPKTTLLMLVSAFGGTKLIRRGYGEAVAARYRFYSYGDAMFITDAKRVSCQPDTR
jgi:S-adenosylmethionine:tRNA ribosyltransferase-isomerase